MNPFKQQTYGKLEQLQDTFLMLFYLPGGSTAGSQTTINSTYYTIWKSTQCNEAMCSGMLNYKTKSKGKPVAFTYTKVSGGYQFTGHQVANYTNTNAAISGEAYYMRTSEINTTTATTDNVSFTVDTTPEVSTFQLEQVNTNLPKDELYTGCWYNLVSNGNNVLPPVYDLPTNINNGLPLFPHTETGIMTCQNNAVLNRPWVLFIPYNNNMSNFSSTCMPVGINTAMFMYNSWIINTLASDVNTDNNTLQYPSKHCYGNLGVYSKNCLYTGLNCNNNYGMMYANKNQGCGKFFGACDEGNCVKNEQSTSNKGFFCSTVPGGTSGIDPSGNDRGNLGKTGGNNVIVWLVIGFISLLLLIMIISWTMDVGHSRKRKMNNKLANEYDMLY